MNAATFFTLVIGAFYVPILVLLPSLLDFQLTLIVWSQVMVQMMVEAAFAGNSTSRTIHAAQIVVG